MLKALTDWFSERAGRAQAVHEINHLESGYFKAKDYTNVDNPRLQYDGPGGRNTGYIRGYDDRWTQEGYQDAQQGRSRSEKFGNVHYDSGWLEGMKYIRKKGFHHYKLDAEYDRLVREHYSKELGVHLGVCDEQ